MEGKLALVGLGQSDMSSGILSNRDYFLTHYCLRSGLTEWAGVKSARRKNWEGCQRDVGWWWLGSVGND